MNRHPYVPEGWPRLIPRISVDDPEGLVRFVREVFDARGTYHAERPSELWIGESLVMIAGTFERGIRTAFLYLYVEDADAVYDRAMAAGALSLEEPRDLPYGDRRAMVEDRWGNTWQVATHTGSFAH